MFIALYHAAKIYVECIDKDYKRWQDGILPPNTDGLIENAGTLIGVAMIVKQEIDKKVSEQCHLEQL